MAITQVLTPEVVDEGPSLIRRSLPSSDKQTVRLFILMDQAGHTHLRSCPAAPIPEQPYARQAVFTYLFEGSIIHENSAGHCATLLAGDAVVMTAGRCVSHRARPIPVQNDRGHQVHYVQLWLALPDTLEE